MRPFRLTLTLVAAIALVIAVAACGSSGSSSSSTAAGGSSSTTSGSSSSSGGLSLAGLANTKPLPTQKMGGTLHLISNEGWEHLDPGASYFQIDYLVVYATQTPLYMFTPSSPTKPVPALADGLPKISSDGKTVTVHIKSGWKWSPPLNRDITSKDVAYAFQRDFNPNVQNGYAAGYYPIVGSDKSAGKPISGISTPNNTTIVFHLTHDFGATFFQSLTLPGSAPVPESLAAPFDKSSPSKYDSEPTKQAFSGPYVIQNYQAGRNITLVRNPNWSRTTDGVRPAYSDKIIWNAGADATVAARQTLDSTDLLMADGPPASVLKSAYETKKAQLSVAPLGTYYASLNTSVPPFNNINLRKAVIAAQNREAYCLARGGKLVCTVATHFIYPEVPGFSQAGGDAGFGQDYVSHPTGDMAVAEKYMKLAGYPSGKYTGNANVLIVGSNSDPGPQEMQIVQNGLQALGFKTTIKAVPQQTMYSKFCGYVKAHINTCPTAGWIEDFADPYAALYVPFSGKTIVPINNVNWAVLNDPKVNDGLDRAAAISDTQQRLAAFAQVDKQIVDDAPAIPEVWVNNPLVEGSHVHGVLDGWNDDWNLSWSSNS
jgi:peptide/nickel transport system substrate-binding protein